MKLPTNRSKTIEKFLLTAISVWFLFEKYCNFNHTKFCRKADSVQYSVAIYVDAINTLRLLEF